MFLDIHKWALSLTAVFNLESVYGQCVLMRPMHPHPCLCLPHDRACEGRVSTAALKVGVMLMCGGELDDKLKCEEVCHVRACVRACVCVSVCTCVCVCCFTVVLVGALPCHQVSSRCLPTVMGRSLQMYLEIF